MALTPKETWLKHVEDCKHDMDYKHIVTAKAENFIEFLNVITAGLGENPKMYLVDLAIEAVEDLLYDAKQAQYEALQEQEHEEELERERNAGKMSDERYDYIRATGL